MGLTLTPAKAQPVGLGAGGYGLCLLKDVRDQVYGQVEGGTCYRITLQSLLGPASERRWVPIEDGGLWPKASNPGISDVQDLWLDEQTAYVFRGRRGGIERMDPAGITWTTRKEVTSDLNGYGVASFARMNATRLVAGTGAWRNWETANNGVLYYSSDASGNAWGSATAPITGNDASLMDLYVSPAGTLYIAGFQTTRGGLYKRINDSSYSLIPTLNSPKFVTRLIGSLVDPKRVYMFTGHTNDDTVAGTESRCYRCNDIDADDATWIDMTPATGTLPADSRGFRDAQIAEVNGSDCLIVNNYVANDNGGPYMCYPAQSSSGGSGWSHLITQPNETNVTRGWYTQGNMRGRAVCIINPRGCTATSQLKILITCVLTGGGQIYLSQNGGATWNQCVTEIVSAGVFRCSGIQFFSAREFCFDPLGVAPNVMFHGDWYRTQEVDRDTHTIKLAPSNPTLNYDPAMHAQDPNTPATSYLTGGWRRSGNNFGLHKTTDNWDSSTRPTGQTQGIYKGCTVSPAGNVYVAKVSTSDTPQPDTPIATGGGIFEYNGSGWSVRNQSGWENSTIWRPRAVDWDFSGSGRLYAGFEAAAGTDHIFHTTNPTAASPTWTALSMTGIANGDRLIPEGRAFRVHPITGDIYFATNAGFYHLNISTGTITLITAEFDPGAVSFGRLTSDRTQQVVFMSGKQVGIGYSKNNIFTSLLPYFPKTRPNFESCKYNPATDDLWGGSNLSGNYVLRNVSRIT